MAASIPARLAVVAVDTDTELMTERFANNTGQATTWIATLFTQLNVFYRRDLDVILMQGTTLLRTSTDPFSNVDTPASQAQLVEFGNWWQANQAAVPRAFAMLLSGKSSSGNSASGIAWLNRYCQSAGNNGSYSINQVSRTPGSGSPTAHSSSATSLAIIWSRAHALHERRDWRSPTPTKRSTSASMGSGCYAGHTPTCPSSGPGAPRGTLMSIAIPARRLGRRADRTCCNSIRRMSRSCAVASRRIRRAACVRKHSSRTASSSGPTPAGSRSLNASACSCRTGSRRDRRRGSRSCCGRRTRD